MTQVQLAPFLVVLFVALVGCPTADRGDGDGDATPDVEVIGPAHGRLPCPGEEFVDVWSFVESGAVVARVDTIAADTAFDPGLWIVDAIADPNSDVADGDDEFPCTFPPPTYSCPEATGTVTGAMPGVYVFTYDDCTSDVGEYALTVTVNGVPVPLTLVRDDHPTG